MCVDDVVLPDIFWRVDVGRVKIASLEKYIRFGDMYNIIHWIRLMKI